jgi:tetratricopeptide (TPR) repeat protein
MDWDTFLQVWANRYGFTPEQRKAFVARFTQANQFKLDKQLDGSDNFKNRMTEVYSKLARDYPLLGQASKGKRELLQTILQGAFDAQTGAAAPVADRSGEMEPPPEVEIHGYRAVRSLLAEARAHLSTQTSQAFYNGTSPQWADIAAGYDVERDLAAELRDFVEARSGLGGPLPIGVVVGRSGDGKTTLLMRLAADLSDRGDRVLWYEPYQLELNLMALAGQEPDRRLVVMVDDAHALDLEKLDQQVQALHASGAGLLLVLGVRQELWAASRQISQSRAEIRRFEIDRVSDAEIDRFLAAYERAGELGQLATLSPAARVAKFRGDDDRQLLVMLLEAKYNEALTDYVQRTLTGLADRFGEKVVRACQFVATLHTFDLAFPAMLLETILDVDELETDILAKTEGWLITDGSGKAIQTRHPVIATVIFQGDRANYRRLSRFIEAELQKAPDYFLTPRLMHNLRLQTKTLGLQVEPLRDVFRQAANCFPIRRFVYNIWAVMESGLKNYDQARKLFDKATQADPNDAPSWQAWAVMESGLKNHAEARRLFQQATEVDWNNAPAWQAWAVMESGLKNHAEARRLFQQATEVDRNHAASWQAWAVMESGLKNHAEARRLFQQATEVDRNHAPVWQAWAVMESGLKNHPEARRLFQQATEVDRNHAPAWQAWAVMESGLKNHPEARRLFQQATEVDQNHAPAWQAWAVMESGLKNHPEARRLFQQATEVDRNHAPAWGGWAIMERNAGNYDKARELFDRTLKLEPHNAKSWRTWAAMERNLGNHDEARRLNEKANQLDAQQNRRVHGRTLDCQ